MSDTEEQVPEPVPEETPPPSPPAPPEPPVEGRVTHVAKTQEEEEAELEKETAPVEEVTDAEEGSSTY